MTEIAFVKIKIDESYLIWMKNSNSFFQLEEPAWYVFNKIAEKVAVEGVAKEFSEFYNFSYEESISFVKDLQLRINEMNQSTLTSIDVDLDFEYLREHCFDAYSDYSYLLGNNTIRFAYGCEWLEDYVHPLISHLQTAGLKGVEKTFELFYHDENVVFRLDGEIKGVWGVNESHLTKGKIFLELINILHGKVDSDWLMTVHASAITNGHKTILFSAAPGSGKTTMAALLQAQGYSLISDDFVPFDQRSKNAYPFPAAMSVKEGAMDLLISLYPELENKPTNYISPEKTVRYLAIDNDLMKMIYPSTEIVFIKYDKSIDFRMSKLKRVEGFKLLLDQVWIPPTMENVELMFERISKFSFYELTYSDNNKALGAINELFNNE